MAPLFGAALFLAVSPEAGGAGKDASVARFAARALSVLDGKDAGPIEIHILRWSTDEEMESLRAALLESGSGGTLPVFRSALPDAAVVLMPGVQGTGARARARRALNCQFARQIETPAGRQVIIATDRHLGLGEETTRNTPPAKPEFVLLDLRFGPDGKGVGKLAPAAKVAYNKETKLLEIENYTAQPVRLGEVQSPKP